MDAHKKFEQATRSLNILLRRIEEKERIIFTLMKEPLTSEFNFDDKSFADINNLIDNTEKLKVRAEYIRRFIVKIDPTSTLGPTGKQEEETPHE
jgi:hypothetical protein